MTDTQADLTFAALRQAYLAGSCTPRELILDRRRQALAQSDYNAWIYLLDEAELEVYLQRLESVAVADLPLYGVPFAIKDNIDLAGVPTTAACKEFAYTPKQSARVVELLIEAGAVPLGKTNLDQFATGLVGVRSPYGEVKNSFNTDYISGGSSAGSAVAMGLGQVAFALGTDTAGSGRVPAVLNNLIGHKPTRGLLSNRGLVPACKSLDCISVFAFTAADAAAVLDVAASYDAQDSYSRSNPYYNRRRYLQADVTAPFRFGVPDELDFQDNPETEQLFTQAIAALSAMGGEAVTVPVAPFLEAAKLLYEGPWVCERWLATEGVEPTVMLPVIREILAGAEGKTATDAFRAQYRLADLKRSCDDLMSDLDVLLTPTMPTVYTRAELAEQPIARNSINGTYTNFVNLLDYSATAIPVGFTASGVPWGVTLVAPAFADVRLLSYAGALQRRFDLPVGGSGRSLPAPEPAAAAPVAQRVDVVVCGAHLDGQPLNWQLVERGAFLRRRTRSAPHYQLYALADGKRPAMVRVAEGGQAIEVEVWSVPVEAFGSFVAGIPEPLGIGKVELDDNRWYCGFICEYSGLEGAKNISQFGAWRAYLAATKPA